MTQIVPPELGRRPMCAGYGCEKTARLYDLLDPLGEEAIQIELCDEHADAARAFSPVLSSKQAPPPRRGRSWPDLLDALSVTLIAIGLAAGMATMVAWAVWKMLP